MSVFRGEGRREKGGAKEEERKRRAWGRGGREGRSKGRGRREKGWEEPRGEGGGEGEGQKGERRRGQNEVRKEGRSKEGEGKNQICHILLVREVVGAQFIPCWAHGWLEVPEIQYTGKFWPPF